MYHNPGMRSVFSTQGISEEPGVQRAIQTNKSNLGGVARNAAQLVDIYLSVNEAHILGMTVYSCTPLLQAGCLSSLC